MKIELSKEDVETILESLKYSKQRIRDAKGTPYDVRNQNLEKIDDVVVKINYISGKET